MAAAVAALRYSSEAHAHAAKAHRELAALLETIGHSEQAEAHRATAIEDEKAALADLCRADALDNPSAGTP
jgi:glycine/D-amino acid oxidase-like deaminating enzyme